MLINMDIKYIILVICLLFVLSVSLSLLIVNNNNRDYISESFTKDYPGDNVISSFSSTYSYKMTNDTYRKVVEPCMRTGVNTLMCVANYKDYFNVILKDHILDIFTKLKQFDGTYVDFISEITTREQYDLALKISSAYSNAMSETLTYIKNKNDGQINELMFTTVLNNTLKIKLDIVLKEIWKK